MMTIPWIEDSLAADLPWLSVAQLVEVDRAMVDDYHILLMQMMELAGRRLAAVSVVTAWTNGDFMPVPRHQRRVPERPPA
ncbi:MAG: hypothetical protein ABIZ91_13885 [Gemmatimonadaceae bacterium]